VEENKRKLGATVIILGAVNIAFACTFFAILTQFFVEIYALDGDDWTNIGMIFIFWFSFLPVAIINPLWILPVAGKKLNTFSLAAYAAEVRLWLLLIVCAFIF